MRSATAHDLTSDHGRARLNQPHVPDVAQLSVSRPCGSWRLCFTLRRHTGVIASARREHYAFHPLAPVTGTRIGVYDITTQIGAGGMGEAGKLTSGGL